MPMTRKLFCFQLPSGKGPPHWLQGHRRQCLITTEAALATSMVVSSSLLELSLLLSLSLALSLARYAYTRPLERTRKNGAKRGLIFQLTTAVVHSWLEAGREPHQQQACAFFHTPRSLSFWESLFGSFSSCASRSVSLVRKQLRFVVAAWSALTKYYGSSLLPCSIPFRFSS